MTPEELEILKAINCKDVETFLAAGNTPAEARAFDELVETLERMRRMGWLELEVAERPAQIGRYRRRYIGAVARCTDAGRRVLSLLGE
jgi:hypothetical protein